MTRRHALPAVAVVAFALLALHPSAARAGEPTLGGMLAPAPITVGTDESVSVENRSSLPVVVNLTSTDESYRVEPDTLTLAVGERAHARIVTTGTEPASLLARFEAADPVGDVRGALVLEAAFVHPGPFDAVPWRLVLLVLAMAAIVLTLVVVRREFQR